MEKEREKVKIGDFIRGMRFGIKLLIVVSILILIIIVLIGFKLMKPDTEKKEVSTITQTSLDKIIEINQLSTVDYTYNAVVKVYDEEKKDLKYYVAYEGIVTAGIDFEKIDIAVNEEQKKVIIKIPDVEIHDVNVNMGTMEYIFAKDKYETETVSQEAYKASTVDLQERVKQEKDLHEMAKENAIASVRALFVPWIEQIDKEYTVEVY